MDPRLPLAVSILAVLPGAACSRPAPSAPPGEDAGPREIAVRVPAALSIARSLDTLSVAADPAMLAATQVTVDGGMVVGFETDTLVFPLGRERPAAGRHGLASGPAFDTGTSTWSTSVDKIPVPGTRYAVEMNVVLFETDVPPGHHWDPHAGRYKALWTRTLRQAEE
jgi:hypothetical protein